MPSGYRRAWTPKNTPTNCEGFGGSSLGAGPKAKDGKRPCAFSTKWFGKRTHPLLEPNSAGRASPPKTLAEIHHAGALGFRRPVAVRAGRDLGAPELIHAVAVWHRCGTAPPKRGANPRGYAKARLRVLKGSP